MYNKEIAVKTDKTLGYDYFLDKNHPLANKCGKVYLHRHVASLSRGYWLSKNEIVHHKDRNKRNNAPDNLEILSAFQHRKEHIFENILKGLGERKERPCLSCSKATKEDKYCSHKCAQLGRRKIKSRPSLEELKKTSKRKILS